MEPVKILAADDNPVARTVLRAFLEKSGYEPLVVEDGPAALAALTGPNAPHIAILDWVMPGLNGLEVCAKLRATPDLPIRPYVLLLTAKNEKSDIALGLDAGADEFISKPFNQIEMLARLRAAQRMIKFQLELQARIDQLESMVQRHRLLGEIISHRQETTSGPPSAPAGNAITKPKAPGSLQLEEIGDALRHAFSDMGWHGALLTAGENSGVYKPAEIAAWGGFFLPKSSDWIDLLVGTDPEAAFGLFEKSMRRRPESDKELYSYLSEIASLVATKCRALLLERNDSLVAPFQPRSFRQGTLNSVLPMPERWEYCRVEFSTEIVTLAVVRSPCPTRHKSPFQLSTTDVLASNFHPSDDYQNPLISQGTILNERLIERLEAYAQGDYKHLRIPVVEPSALAIHFNPDFQA